MLKVIYLWTCMHFFDFNWMWKDKTFGVMAVVRLSLCTCVIDFYVYTRPSISWVRTWQAETAPDRIRTCDLSIVWGITFLLALACDLRSSWTCYTCEKKGENVLVFDIGLPELFICGGALINPADNVRVWFRCGPTSKAVSVQGLDSGIIRNW